MVSSGVPGLDVLMAVVTLDPDAERQESIVTWRRTVISSTTCCTMS